MPNLNRPRKVKFALDDGPAVYDTHNDDLHMSDASDDEATAGSPYKKRKVMDLMPNPGNKRAAYKEMILKSKAAKYERQETLEKAQAEREDMDEELAELLPLMGTRGRAKTEDEPDEFDNIMSDIKRENDRMPTHIT